MRDKTVLVGNPVREAVARLGEAPFPGFDDIAPLRILVTGGSQGASILGQVVPEGLGMLEPSLRHRLQVTQQCRADDIDAVRKRYAELEHPRRADDLYRRHARQARLGASDHRPGRRLDHRRADRGGTAGDPGSAADRDRRSPDRQCARDGAGGRRADDPAGRLHPGDAGPPDRGDGGRSAGAGQCRRRGPCRSGGPHAARDLADLAERIGGGAVAGRGWAGCASTTAGSRSVRRASRHEGA